MSQFQMLSEFDKMLGELYDRVGTWKATHDDGRGCPVGWPKIYVISGCMSGMRGLSNRILYFGDIEPEYLDDPEKRAVIEQYMRTFEMLKDLIDYHLETIRPLITEVPSKEAE